MTDQPQAPNSTRAVIWDMDGVIADTAPYHFKTWQEAFRKRGAEFTEAEFKRLFGQRADNIIRSTLGQDMPQDEVDAIVREKNENFRRALKNSIKPLPGAIELIESLVKNGFRVALASSAPIQNIQLIINTLGIYNLFNVIVFGREVLESKPSPQIFLLAAQKLGVEPENCIVIEDAIAGVAAARRAGMHCIAITSTNTGERLQEADLIVDTLESITVKDLKKLFSNSIKG